MWNLTNSWSLIDEIEWKQDILTPWHWIDITNNVISTTWWWGWSSAWWDITWTLSDQTDLQAALDEKQHELITWAWLAITESKWWLPAKWPCPDWYHIGTNTEWQTITTLFNSMQSWPTTAQKLWFLKLPFPWYIDAPDGVFYKWWVEWAYWTSTCNNDNQSYTYEIKSNATRSAPWRNATWIPIRPFKNVAVEPDPNTWTALYTDTNVSIYWEPTEWIISFRRAANIAWTTIADKNVWATIVWNYWDTVSAANCWDMFQWWNNHWFTWWVDPAITSVVQVDWSQYSWENPYESSTFVLSVWQAWYWNPVNYDLWWWQSASSKEEWVYIENSWVLSLNGRVWNMTIVAWDDMKIERNQNTLTLSSTVITKDSIAPSSPAAGQMWFDTANGDLYIHNWTERKQIAFV